MGQDSVELILYKLAELNAKVEELRADQKALASRTPCPNPGACILLSRDVEDLTKREEAREARVRHLEALVDQATGFGIAAKAVWALIGAGGLGVGYAIMRLVN